MLYNASKYQCRGFIFFPCTERETKRDEESEVLVPVLMILKSGKIPFCMVGHRVTQRSQATVETSEYQTQSLYQHVHLLKQGVSEPIEPERQDQ